MKPEILDLSVIEKAIQSLHEALSELEKDKNNSFVRDSCIQRFEYCYDLSAKIITRYLSITSQNPGEIKEMTFQDVIRLAYTKGIVKNSWDIWWEYRDNRNATSHGYDEKRAIEITSKIPNFYHEVVFLFNALSSRNEA